MIQPAMPVRLFTPNRAWFMVATGSLVTMLNIMLNLDAVRTPAHEQDCLARLLSGPPPQDDPSILAWIRTKVHDPSTEPYNIDFTFSAILSDVTTEEVFSPSQDFIVSKVEELLGNDIEKGGTFLEAGAYTGDFLSNTLFLEHSYGWTGVLVEPHPLFFQTLLTKHRKAWAINACLSTHKWPSQEVFVSLFGDPSTNHLVNGGAEGGNRVVEENINLASSGLAKFSTNTSRVSEQFMVQCVPLFSILKSLDMTRIDFLSLDVERAEMKILETIPWERVTFSILSIEHDTLEDLRSFLRPRGYIHVESFFQDHIFVNKKRFPHRLNPAPNQNSSQKLKMVDRKKNKRMGKNKGMIQRNRGARKEK